MRALALLLALAGCAATPPCVPKVQTVSINIPVPVKCISATDIPLEPGTSTLTGDARNDSALLASKVGELRVWGRQLVGMMQPCTTP